jgi:hypothetical protein
MIYALFCIILVERLACASTATFWIAAPLRGSQ